MIKRYESIDISKIWQDEYKFKLYLNIELAFLKAMEDFGDWDIPTGTHEKIFKLVTIDVDRILLIEKETGHDTVAFCRHVEEQCPQEVGKYFHFGVTSSDVSDTALALQIKDSIAIILEDFKELERQLELLVSRSMNVVCAGRSHGQVGEPMLLAQKWWGHSEEFKRRRQELETYFHSEIKMKCSGAMGNYTIVSPYVEYKASKILGISNETVSTQIVPRDRLAKLVSIGSLYASALERFCTEIRHLSRSEVGEVSEGFKNGQTGSSTMPHKKNPVATENLTGIARVMRSHNLIALENIVTLHERDISHSSTERLYLPDHLGLWSYSLRRLSIVISSLVIHEDVIKNNLLKFPHVVSSLYLHHAISKLGFSRRDAYEAIQSASFDSNSKNIEEFRDAVTKNLNVCRYSFPRFEWQDMIEHYSRTFFELRKLSK